MSDGSHPCLHPDPQFSGFGLYDGQPPPLPQRPCDERRAASSWAVVSEAGSKSPRFHGERVNIVQIGLGTFGTFVQNLAGEESEQDAMVAWLLKALSENQPGTVSGVAVEPVPEHLWRLRAFSKSLPNVALMQLAVGEHNSNSQIYVLTSEAHQSLLKEVKESEREALESDLLYLRNMSSLGKAHASLVRFNQYLESKYGLTVTMEPIDNISVWTYDTLANHLDFCGCEVLLIDAEGYDTAILRSLMEHCAAMAAQLKDAWPEIIQFESMGHCDIREKDDAEAKIISSLQSCGYKLIFSSYYNTVLVRASVITLSRIANWLNTSFVCAKCGKKGLDAGLPFAMCNRHEYICGCCFGGVASSAES